MRILSVYRKLFVLERCPYWGGVRMERFDCTGNDVNIHFDVVQNIVADRVWLAFGGEIISAHAL